MQAPVRSVLHRAFPRYTLRWRAYRLLVANEDSYLYSTGWMKSLREGKPVDKEGRALPWLNFPVIRFLEDRLKADFNLFEFGSGYSTSFYAARVKSVTSVESDLEWFRIVSGLVPSNATLIFQERDANGKYCRAITTTGQKYDVVVIDGRDRVNCIKQSIGALTERGVMLLDDSQRARYAEGIQFAKAQGFRAIDFEGLKPTIHEVSRATIFYRRENCFDI